MFGMRIIGPAAAGMLVAAFGPKVCYWLDAVSFFASASFITSVAIKRSSRPSPHTAEDKGAIAKVWHDMQQGMNFILHHAALLFVILAMSAGMFVLGCFGPLIAVYVRDSVHAATTVYGCGHRHDRPRHAGRRQRPQHLRQENPNTTLVYCGLLGIAVGLVVLCSAHLHLEHHPRRPHHRLSVAGIIIPAQTLMQQETPPELMGRVGSAPSCPASSPPRSSACSSPGARPVHQRPQRA
jgi:DHA3 family macrolide efflux protein-like MFS transporter